MSSLYALLVGIDRYHAAEIPDLAGCRNDIAAALALLQSRCSPGATLHPRVLLDGAASRAALIDGFRSHLGQAGPGDTALFWFSGHGSEGAAPDWAWFEEPSGRIQTLVCADSRVGGAPDLYDKELSILLDELTRRGCHVVAVLDCCYSGGATRELHRQEPAALGRAVLDPAPPPARKSLLAGFGTKEIAAGTRAPDHVGLLASRAFETAQEHRLGGRRHGLFSWSLLRALGRLGPTATYRELLTAAQTEVEQRALRQVPQLLPTTPGIADQPFLGGLVTRPAAGVVLRYAASGWEINIGSCHGLPSGYDTARSSIRVGVPGTEPLREAVVTQVLTERSLVDPLGWYPAHDEQFRVVLTDVPIPRTTVAVDSEEGDPAVAGRLHRALTSGPEGRPSPFVRLAGAGEKPDLRATVRGDVLRILDQHQDQLGTDFTGPGGAGVTRAMAALEHVARWRQILDLGNPATTLTGAVRIEIVKAEPGDETAPPDRPALTADTDGLVRLHYGAGPTGWVPPEVFIRLRNTSDRKLFCVLLDLTGRFRIHATLFPGDFIAAGGLGAAVRGGRVRVALPDGYPPEPGRSVRDWLKLFVAEEQFSAEPFELPPLGQPIHETRGGLAVRGLLERLGRNVVRRDMAATGDDDAYDWATDTVVIETAVPGPVQNVKVIAGPARP